MNTQTLSLFKGALIGAGLLTVALAFTACGGGGGGGGGGAAPVVPVVGAMAIPSALQFTAVSSQSGLPVFQAGTQMAAIQQSSFVPEAGFVEIMRRAMGICDRNLVNGGYDLGYFSCQTMASAPQWVMLDFASAQANTATLSIYTDTTRVVPATGLNGTMPSLTTLLTGMVTGYMPINFNNVMNPLVLNNRTVAANSPVTIWPINKSQGFQVSSLGPSTSAAWGQKFELRVPVGKLENTSFDFELYFHGVRAGAGRMVRTK